MVATWHFVTTQRWQWRLTIRVLRTLAHGVVGAFIVLLAGGVVFLESRPDLEPWHTVHLDEEFTTDTDVASVPEYLALEERLFAQLDRAVYHTHTDGEVVLNRYHRESLSDPQRWPTNWNRTFVRVTPEPRAGVLLLHGLSDSPYSMRSLAESLHDAGATVLGLRLPGHGTAPSGLVHAQWEDWAAAVELAMRHLHETVGDRPLFIVGYSNGGALAVTYALATLADPALPAIEGVVLMSPEIGISKLAGYAAWQERLGRLLRLRKLSWNSISVEYDPFKYQSFALNAARQAYRLTMEIQDRISALTESGDIERFPTLLAFQSAVDATVSARALVEGLFERLSGGRHELVAFDLNRAAGMEPLFTHDPRSNLEALLANRSRTFAFTLVTNQAGGSSSVIARHAAAGDAAATTTDLGMTWPRNLYSLSHVALPFPPDDPLYGGPDARPGPGPHIGDAVLRGERGALKLSPADLLRIRWNPFHTYLEQRTLAFTGLADAPAAR